MRRLKSRRDAARSAGTPGPGWLCLAAALLGLVGVGCSREEVTRNAPPALRLGRAGEIPLPDEAYFADKRGFCDVNGDGLTDMLEIGDHALIGQSWQADIFLGERSREGLLHFRRPYKTSFPLRAEWLRSSLVKLDTADVNGDGFCDVVMTQYQAGLRSDRFHIMVGLNAGDGHRFTFVEDISRSKVPLGEQLLRVMEHLQDEHDDIKSWLKMDWADFDGDGRDDLWLISRRDFLGRHLTLEVWPNTTEKGARQALTFGPEQQVSLPGFLTRLSVANADTEDMDGDGRADLVIYDPHIGTGLRVAYARNSAAGFVIHHDFEGHEIEMDLIGFEKRDTLDINLDGCADYVHAGTHGKQRAMSYLLSPCDEKPATRATPGSP